MKDSSKYAARLTKLLSRIRKEIGKIETTKPNDFVAELVTACLSSYDTEAKAVAAVKRLKDGFVDYNHLRVAKADELVEVVGKNYPSIKEAAEQILRILHALYDRQDNLELDSLKNMGKREAKAYIEELEGVTPYIAAWMMLRCIQGHAFPIHEAMMTMLRGEEVIDPGADAATVQGFMERQLSATKVQEHYTLLRRHADGYPEYKAGEEAASSTSKVKSPAKTKTKKKTAKSVRKKSPKP